MSNFKVFAILIVMLAMTACSDSNQSGAGQGPEGNPNPLITDEYADPHVLLHEGVYYMYGTDSPNDHYNVYTSTDMYNWQEGPEIFRIGSNNMWAPDVYYDADTSLFYLWYSADYKIGLAIASSPLGPFVDQGIKIQDAIDAFLFKDSNGDWYLYYEAIKEAINIPADLPVIGKLWVQPLQTPSIFKDVAPTLVIEADQPWEILPTLAEITEAPWVFEHKGTYYMMYSGNMAGDKNYAIGYATASSPMGPWTKSADSPILSVADGLSGPGHHSIATGPDGNLYMFYHQKLNFLFNDFNRQVAIDRFTINDDGSLSVGATPLSTQCLTEECYSDAPVLQ